MGFETPNFFDSSQSEKRSAELKKPKKPEEMTPEEKEEYSKLGTRSAVRVEEVAKNQEEDKRVPVGGFESPDNLTIKKPEQMTPQEREKWEEENKKMGVRPRVRL